MKVFSALLILALAGCAPQLAPPGMPTIAQVQAQMASTTVIHPSQVRDFYSSGLFLVQSQCGGYFDQAVMNALSSAQTNGQVQLLAGLASGLIGLAGASGPAAAGVSLGTSVIGNMIANQQANSLAGSDPAASATLVATAQQKLIDAISEPLTAADAWASIYAVYRACSPAGIRAMQEQAIAAAANHLTVTGGNSGLPASHLRNAPVTRSPVRSMPMIRVE